MDIYIFNALFLFLFSLLAFNKQKKGSLIQASLVIAIIWLTLYEGLRWEVGTDWEAYYKNFINQDWDGHHEIGYIVINYILYFFSGNYTFFLLVLSSFFYGSLYFLLRKYSQAPIMSLTIYYCTMLWLLGCNRQLIAMFICLLSLRYVFNHKLLPYVLMVLLAFSFHSTALFFLPAYYIINREISDKAMICAAFVFLIIGFSGVINHIPLINYAVYLDGNSADKLSFYTQGDIYSYSYVGSLKRLVILFICILVKKKVKHIYFAPFLKLYFVGCSVFFLFNGSILQLISSRGALFYNIAEVFIIPSMIYALFKNGGLRLIAWVGYFVVIFYIMNRDMDSYASGLGYEVFRPYRSVLF